MWLSFPASSFHHLIIILLLILLPSLILGKMSYEPGVLVRRQQREYPQELRKEIALAALEVGNNREVARLYSERLGYTVNESTVRGIKKRYLEGVQKGKIESVEERESK